MCVKTNGTLGFGSNCPVLHGIATQIQEHEDSEKVRQRNAPKWKEGYLLSQEVQLVSKSQETLPHWVHSYRTRAEFQT